MSHIVVLDAGLGGTAMAFVLDMLGIKKLKEIHVETDE